MNQLNQLTPLLPGVLPQNDQEFESQPFLALEIPGRLPSWNEILGMEHWARYKFKDSLQADFLSALRACGAGSSTLTTSAKNITSIAADTLGCYRAMVLDKRKLRSAKKKSQKANPSLLESSSSEPGKIVPF